MKILLLTPPYDLMGQGYGTKRKIKAGFFPPLALGYLASPLLKKGHQVKIIDCLPLNYTNEDIGREVSYYRPDLIGLSAVTADSREAGELVNYLKERFPDLPIVFGGPHVNCFPDKVFADSPRLEMIVIGEGERAFEQIVDYYNEKRRLPLEVAGSWLRREDGSIKKNPPAEPVMNLDEILPPAHQLFDYKLYRPLPLQYKRLPVANMLTSRGCPWGMCTFCFESGRASQRYRRHSPQRVIEEIKFLIKTQGIREVAFWDDNFLVNQDWVFKFCDLLDREKLNLPWTAYGRVNTITRPMLKRARQSGLWSVFYGIESGNADLLKRIKKGITLEQIRQAIGWSNELGIESRGSLMLALPGETPEQAEETINFACDIGLTYAQFLPTHPEWGTELYDDALSSGRIVPLYQGRTTPTYVPDGYRDAEEVKQMLQRAYRRFYFRPGYIWAHLKRLRHLSKLKQYFDAVSYIIGVGF